MLKCKSYLESINLTVIFLLIITLLPWLIIPNLIALKLWEASIIILIITVLTIIFIFAILSFLDFRNGFIEKFYFLSYFIFPIGIPLLIIEKNIKDREFINGRIFIWKNSDTLTFEFIIFIVLMMQVFWILVPWILGLFEWWFLIFAIAAILELLSAILIGTGHFQQKKKLL
ncbi:hypothetical protein SALLE_v1c02150 [Spiroplasma alleghenense]|uniref:Transmembrane protein n=1 Tax=Spiroplasma alleghenense TaxID=216931 RepID=A0A345Z2R2_9MOLU|nr:hypothetical protein SALLE_v1c02150 [Spiroplasma alleghenense]